MGGIWTVGGIWALRLVIMMAAIRISGGHFSPSSPEVPRYHAQPCPRLMWQAGKLASAEQKGGVEMAFQAPVVCDDVLALRMRGGSGADGQDIGGGWFEFRDASTGNAYVRMITFTHSRCGATASLPFHHVPLQGRRPTHSSSPPPLSITILRPGRHSGNLPQSCPPHRRRLRRRRSVMQQPLEQNLPRGAPGGRAGPAMSDWLA